mmetsp:Transcript_23062/g.60920  ORF Transcript_23062/g.60920 Transcript_23062/m.60920 type:complete len:208 (-) Transcript_23062:180-803(-)
MGRPPCRPPQTLLTAPQAYTPEWLLQHVPPRVQQMFPQQASRRPHLSAHSWAVRGATAGGVWRTTVFPKRLAFWLWLYQAAGVAALGQSASLSGRPPMSPPHLLNFSPHECAPYLFWQHVPSLLQMRSSPQQTEPALAHFPLQHSLSAGHHVLTLAPMHLLRVLFAAGEPEQHASGWMPLALPAAGQHWSWWLQQSRYLPSVIGQQP